MQGPATLLALGALVVAAGVCVAAWGFARRPAELALAAGVAAVSFAVIPVHTLGWAGALTRGSLFAATAALALSVLIGTLAATRGRARVLLAVRSLGLLVRESALLPWRERSVALLGLLAVVALVAWTSVLTYYAPSSAWDGVMYHEPMVGFALQNHGFAWVGYERANAMLGPVDGYPRVTEDLMLFLVAAWDRRVIELVPGLMVPILLAATYVLLRRFVRSRASALGLACGLVLIPGVVLQLRSTYVDVTFVTFVAAAAAFLCRREPGPAELWMAGLSLGLVAGSKVTGLMVAPLIGALGVALAVRAVVRRKRPVLLAHLAGGFLLVCAIGGPTYARNWSETQNLTWPSTVQMEPLGIDWQGPLAITNMNVPNDRRDRVVLRAADPERAVPRHQGQRVRQRPALPRPAPRRAGPARGALARAARARAGVARPGLVRPSGLHLRADPRAALGEAQPARGARRLGAGGLLDRRAKTSPAGRGRGRRAHRRRAGDALLVRAGVGRRPRAPRPPARAAGRGARAAARSGLHPAPDRDRAR
ncbi:MAG: phospholipid carrier-dependent glycosyltransferase [Sandaracinaceae bacterium]|nr:phospholipid carrier-dependent glycosyltransferase [Sandaracinaceae bacterium]